MLDHADQSIMIVIIERTAYELAQGIKKMSHAHMHIVRAPTFLFWSFFFFASNER